MKKLLIGLTLLASMSAFANESLFMKYVKECKQKSIAAAKAIQALNIENDRDADVESRWETKFQPDIERDVFRVQFFKIEPLGQQNYYRAYEIRIDDNLHASNPHLNKNGCQITDIVRVN